MVEMDYDVFLDKFMPANGRDLPRKSRSTKSKAKIPKMSKANLMGSEAKVCEELVRSSCTWSCACMLMFSRCNTVQGIQGDIQPLQGHGEASSENDAESP